MGQGGYRAIWVLVPKRLGTTLLAYRAGPRGTPASMYGICSKFWVSGCLDAVSVSSVARI